MTDIFEPTTVFSLLAALAVLVAAYSLSLQFLPKSTPGKLRLIYIWHLFDALIHFTFEGSFLYNCFFVYTTGKNPNGFLNQPSRIYGPAHGSSPTAKLWQEYAKADARWGEADLTVISLELLTVFVAGPLALWICECIRKHDRQGWFWMTILASCELYGGFMTFCPEWLTGSPNLDTSNFMYLWVYLVFFNTLWVWFPIYVLYEAYQNISVAFEAAGSGSGFIVERDGGKSTRRSKRGKAE
ncbi:MAG: autophagy protein 17 [Chaenotheca gracillima]|nr:MAG: autophagy protein 17 [Chaenotheca gracillima]